ncbi:MAG: hypothetical protein HN394_20995 [Rhodospirillaceae bacterium]|nr:hypothetical protein [Rhodospirillaceae bacterium]MBT3532344.1 hypothetical protein [Rhodospirillaceae bacterium]MBT4489168.1 hypothetical protein [Rhodospirillaceae bacterium]MBT5192910.1 hypothetical protein [Rhodospirillaceae bacterium]MBT5898396.1 hypothetical protein [Rhodospirillaceae bacterium]
MGERIDHRAGGLRGWLLAALIAVSGCAYEMPDLPEPARIQDSVLFPSNERVMTTYCTAGKFGERSCHLAAFDLDGSNVKVYATPPGHRWQGARFSPDGKAFVFELNDTGRFSNKLAIMNRASGQWRIIEGSDSFKNWPSYHPNGKQIVFAVFDRTPDNYQSTSHVKTSGADMHNLDLATNKVRALTDFRFAKAGPPHFTGRGDEIVFGGYDPRKFLQDPNNSHHASSYDELYQTDTIYTVNETKHDWRPDFVIDGGTSLAIRAYSGHPIPSRGGKIIYFRSNLGKVGRLINSSRSNAIWIRENGQNRKLFNFSAVTGLIYNSTDFSLSSDKMYFLIWSSGRPFNSEEFDKGLWRVGVDGSNPRRLHIPWARLAVFTRKIAKAE